MTSGLASVVQSQLTALDDTESYATAWQLALSKATKDGRVQWGGRGKGGRGLARRTFQPKDIVVDNVRLEFVGSKHGASRVLLDNASLRLLSSRVYALVGRNAAGKSTLLRSIDAGSIPGYPPHVSSLYIPQEGIHLSTMITCSDTSTPMELLRSCSGKSTTAIQSEIESLEILIEGLDMNSEEDVAQMERITSTIASLEDQTKSIDFERCASEALKFVGLTDEALWHTPLQSMSMGLRRRALLAVCLYYRVDLLLLDEPTNGLDIEGLLMLRELIEYCSNERNTTVLLVSHDRDLIDDIADHVIDFFDTSLLYYNGNYSNYCVYRQQNTLHEIREALALDKKRAIMEKGLDNLKKQPVPKRGGVKKKSKRVENQRKRIEREVLDKDIGSRMTNSTGRGMNLKILLDHTKKSVIPHPDKSVQFSFREVASRWGEPLIMAYDVGHGFDIDALSEMSNKIGTPSNPLADDSAPIIRKKDGYLFDCLDLCINESGKYCIVGSSGCGKTTLLKLLAKQFRPLQGNVKHVAGLSISYMDQKCIDSLVESVPGDESDVLSYLLNLSPKCNEQTIRAELSSFGLSPQQITTQVRFLSGGERSRLFLAHCMLHNPHVLIMDDPTAHLDMESVNALVYGLSHWNGTVVMVSHDTNFIRSLDAQCYALMADEGKLRRVDGGIDTYLRSFA